MAVTRPLRGLRYDPARTAVARALAPPYDVIDEAQRERLYGLGPHNIVRVDFGRDEPGDIPGERDRYTRARDLLSAWSLAGVLRRDPRPAAYVHDHGFQDAVGWTLNRRGVIVGVRALPWDQADVLPHERTLRGPKADRLALMRATRTQTSAVLLIWDRAPGLAELLAAACAADPDLSAETDGEVAAENHRLWVVDNPTVVAEVVEALAPARLYMADGHHRFETAAAYAAERRAAELPASPEAGFAWVLAELCAADDPALLVLPTHRLVLPRPGVPNSLAELMARLPARWRVEPTPDLAAAVAAAAAQRDRAHALAVAGSDGAALLLAGREPSASPRARLDVSVVEDEILGRACGLDAASIAAGALDFAREVEDAGRAVAEGRAGLALCLNGCTTREMIEVSDAGEQMPQKSTYFSPKVPTGLVLSPL
ncbi:MAG TPA: DUF1015 domain-containing protein [Candidatus Dormibacteraeota bacterium]